jgi:hypothetical protein
LNFVFVEVLRRKTILQRTGSECDSTEPADYITRFRRTAEKQPLLKFAISL